MSEGVGENPDNKGGQCLGTVGKGQMPQRGQAGYTQEHSGAHSGQRQRSGGVEARIALMGSDRGWEERKQTQNVYLLSPEPGHEGKRKK